MFFRKTCKEYVALITTIKTVSRSLAFWGKSQEADVWTRVSSTAGRKLQQGGASPYSDCASQDVVYDTSDSWDLTTEDIKDLDRYIQEPPWEPLVGGLQDMDLLEQSVPIPYGESGTPPPPFLSPKHCWITPQELSPPSLLFSALFLQLSIYRQTQMEFF